MHFNVFNYPFYFYCGIVRRFEYFKKGFVELV